MILLLALAAAAAVYQALALGASLVFRFTERKAASAHPPVSVLKPVRGLDPAFRQAIESHTKFAGDYEFLCGVHDLNDPAAKLLAEFQNVGIIESRTQTANGKVGALIDLAAAARHQILVVNDSDIQVELDYLDRVTAPLTDPRVGLVTCLYRPVGDTFPARFEGLGILTDFAPSVLVARITGVDEFAMGSTLAFRKKELERIGGFAAFADFIADDYQLGHRIHSLGLRCELSDVVVETHMGGNWTHVFQHQLRWARTIRVSHFGGYLGLPITNATLWAILLAVFGHPVLALGLMMLRLLMAIAAGSALRSGEVVRLLPLVPLRDLFGFAIWLAGLFGKRVMWRGLLLELDKHGRILNT